MPASRTPATSPLTSNEVRRHLPHVRRIASRIVRRLPPSVDRDDLVAAGLLGLVEAYARARSTHDEPTSSYIELRVRGAILDALRELDPLSRWAREAQRRRDDAERALEGQLGRVPTEGELVRALDVQVEKHRARELTALRARATSLSPLLESDESAELWDRRAPPVDEQLDALRLEEWLRRALLGLPPRLRSVVQGYVVETPVRVLGEQLGVTEGRVSQLRAQALGLLRGELVALLGEGRDLPRAA